MAERRVRSGFGNTNPIIITCILIVGMRAALAAYAIAREERKTSARCRCSTIGTRRPRSDLRRDRICHAGQQKPVPTKPGAILSAAVYCSREGVSYRKSQRQRVPALGNCVYVDDMYAEDFGPLIGFAGPIFSGL